MAKARAACLAITLLAVEKEPVKRKPRSEWVKEWLKNRPRYTHVNLMTELSIISPWEFRQFVRMDIDTFHELLALVEPLIKKKQHSYARVYFSKSEAVNDLAVFSNWEKLCRVEVHQCNI